MLYTENIICCFFISTYWPLDCIEVHILTTWFLYLTVYAFGLFLFSKKFWCDKNVDFDFFCDNKLKNLKNQNKNWNKVSFALLQAGRPFEFLYILWSLWCHARQAVLIMLLMDNKQIHEASTRTNWICFAIDSSFLAELLGNWIKSQTCDISASWSPGCWWVFWDPSLCILGCESEN